MRDSLALALIRAERCRVVTARWSAPTDSEAASIVEAADLLLRLAERMSRTIRASVARRRRAATPDGD
jgi:hypothetical protein